MSNKRFQAGFFGLLVFFSASSCRYQVGYPLENSGKSIFLDVENRSTAPQFGPVLNRMLKEELVQVGDPIDVKILRVDIEERKIGLSKKQVSDSETSATAETAPAETSSDN